MPIRPSLLRLVFCAAVIVALLPSASAQLTLEARGENLDVDLGGHVDMDFRFDN